MNRHNYNVLLRSSSGLTLRAVGKIIDWEGQRIFHGWGSSNYVHRNSNTIALNRGVVERCKAEGVSTVFIYDKERDITYGTTVDALERLGTPATPDTYGQNLRLPLRFWSTRSGRLRVPFVPEDIAEIVEQPEPIYLAHQSEEDDEGNGELRRSG